MGRRNRQILQSAIGLGPIARTPVGIERARRGTALAGALGGCDDSCWPARHAEEDGLVPHSKGKFRRGPHTDWRFFPTSSGLTSLAVDAIVRIEILRCPFILSTARADWGASLWKVRRIAHYGDELLNLLAVGREELFVRGVDVIQSLFERRRGVTGGPRAIPA
jgi:hypothetical protein